MKNLKIAFLASMLLITAACASLGLSSPANESQKLAYSYSTLAAIRASTAQALTVGTITVKDAQKVLADTDGARAALDAGRVALIAGNTGTVEADLAAATAAITQIQLFLTTKGVNK